MGKRSYGSAKPQRLGTAPTPKGTSVTGTTGKPRRGGLVGHTAQPGQKGAAKPSTVRT